MIKNSSSVILVGGESKRMKSDKAQAVLSGETLLKRVYAAVSPFFTDIMVSAHTEGYELDMNLPSPPRVIPDTLPGRGPALGICSALQSADNPWVFVTACDQPMISGKLIEYLAGLREGFDAVVPVAEGKVQTLLSFYKNTCLEPLTLRIKDAGVKARGRSMVDFLKDTDSLKVRYVEEEEMREADPELRSFMDIDTPDELTKAENIITKKIQKKDIG